MLTANFVLINRKLSNSCRKSKAFIVWTSQQISACFAGQIRNSNRRIARATEKEIVQQQARNDLAESDRFLIAGKYAEARQSIEKALESDKKEFGAESLTVVTDSNQRGRILAELGEYEEAIRMSEQILAVRGRSAEPDHYRFGITLFQLGNDYGWLEDYPKSIEYYRQALTIFRSVLGDGSPPVAAALMNLGEDYKLLGDDVKALEYYRTALDIQEKSAKPEDYNTASVLVNIGAVYCY